jgi:hypothetical protein
LARRAAPHTESLREELLIGRHEISEAALEEIVDTILLPLLATPSTK